MADEKKLHSSEEEGVKTFRVVNDHDIVKVRECARDIADQIGFTTNERTLIATAVSEICRNVIEYAGEGTVLIQSETNNPKSGISITVEDSGPGIEDVKKAMQDGYSTSRGMGVGLPGSKRIMDDFKIYSEVGKGTRVIMSKWIQ